MLLVDGDVNRDCIVLGIPVIDCRCSGERCLALPGVQLLAVVELLASASVGLKAVALMQL